jgi:2-polyprenyl-6-methoxyphenol hydroxylase-like FAD-dependent oxidoreductase
LPGNAWEGHENGGSAVMKDFEVIVVGAGLGGLSAATFLTQAGKRVLLLEKHNVDYLAEPTGF